MFNTTKIAICLGLMIGASSAALAKDQYTQKGMATSTQKSDGFYSFGQAPGQTWGSCWVPTGDDSGEYGADFSRPRLSRILRRERAQFRLSRRQPAGQRRELTCGQLPSTVAQPPNAPPTPTPAIV